MLDYQLDITPALIGNDADTIATLDVSVAPNEPGDLSVDSARTDGASAVLWLSGGQSGTVYTLTLLITTVNGRTVQRSIFLPVLSLSSPAAPSTAIVTNTGLMITDQNGNPVVIG